MRLLLLATLISAATVWQASAASVSRSYSYFSIGGETLGEIEKELGRHGPRISDGGQRHPGATRMQFTSRLTYAETKRNGRSTCRVQAASVTVTAKVILPRWRRPAKAEDSTRLIWETLAADIKRHEESHIGIARNFARELEAGLTVLPAQGDCQAAARRAEALTTSVLKRHDEEQARFDRIESKGFEKRLLALLRYRLEQTRR